MSWEGDAIVFGQGRKGLMRVSANGGVPEVLVSPKNGEVMQSPQLLPDGQTVLFTIAASTDTDADLWDKANIVVHSLTKGERHTVVAGGSDARYIPTGHLVYAVRGVVFAVPFDVRQLQVKSGPTPVIEGVRRASGNPPTTGAANFSVSHTGSLIYVPGPTFQSSDQLEIVIANGSEVSRLKLPPGPYTVPRVSPDGQRIAFGTDDGKNAGVWVYELSGATSLRPLTFTGRNRFPIWTSDSKRVVFQSDRESDFGIFATMADGSGATERLTKADKGTSHVPESWSPSGDALAFSTITGSDHSLWTFSMPTKKATPFDNVHSSTPIGAVFSPDSRWIAYTSTSSTQAGARVYVQPFPPTSAKHQIFAQSGDGPHHPVWAPNGKALFYTPRQAAFASVDIRLQPTFAFGNPVPLPRPFNGAPPSSRRPYDITPEGKFIGLVPAGFTDSSVASAQAQVIEVVVHWFEELKARVPVK
jgi:Tol biopolymer transport system component